MSLGPRTRRICYILLAATFTALFPAPAQAQSGSGNHWLDLEAGRLGSAVEQAAQLEPTPTVEPARAASAPTARPAANPPPAAPTARPNPPAAPGSVQTAPSPSPTTDPSRLNLQVAATGSLLPITEQRVRNRRSGSEETVRTLKTTRLTDGREAIDGRVLVTFRDGVSENEHAAAHTASLSRGVSAVQGLEKVSRDLHAVSVPGTSVEQAVAAYRADPRVKHAQPDYVMKVDEVPNDPMFSSQWGLSKIGAATAWNRTHGSSSINVAVLDCGIYESGSALPGYSGHPDLNGKIEKRVNFSPASSLDDLCDHGSHVAGIVAANTGNGVGIAGVGYNTRLFNVKVCNDFGSCPTSAVVNGIRWAADNGAHVINLSLGGIGSCLPAEQDAINYAWNRNVVIVASAGNNGSSSVTSPASCNNVLSVANTDQNDNKSGTSSFGSWVDVAAPGNGILSTDFLGAYVNKSGTSMAAPHVSGLAALLRGSTLSSNSDIVSRIKSTADRISGTGTNWESGRINAARAFDICSPTRPTVSVTTSPDGSGRLRVTVSVSGGTRIERIDFGVADNALIDIGSVVGSRGSISPTIGAASTGFTVRRQDSGRATTVPFTVRDDCGSWPTFAGGGPGAF